MPTYKVKHPIGKDGKDYPRGSEIELTKEEALVLADCIFDPPTPASAGDKDLAAALESQRNRPNLQESSISVDDDARRERANIEQLAQAPAKATAVKTDAKMEGNKKP